MGRRRKDGDPLGLAGTRLALKRGKFWYRERGTDRHLDFGTDLVEAKRKAARYNDPGSDYGTVAYWFRMFLDACELRVKAKTLAKRTLHDYKTSAKEGGPLHIFFGDMLPEHIEPNHVQAYLDKGAEAGRPIPANRDRACLSAMLSWLLRQPDSGSVLRVNPCMRRSGVKRNKETQRERYVTDDEYREVLAVASKRERLLMELTYRTLQRPESDIILWTTAVVVTTSAGRVLEFVQNKTKKRHRIAFSDELELLLPASNVRPLKPAAEPIIRRLDGEAITYGTMLKRLHASIAVANERRKARGIAPMASFGFRDLKGKGATDMWRAGVPLKEIQQLCGHANQTTTEKYVKARWQETAQPNRINGAA